MTILTNNKLSYFSYDELPVVLTANELSALFHISKASAYALLRQDSFPTIHIGEKRMVVSKDALFSWLNRQSQAKTAMYDSVYTCDNLAEFRKAEMM